MTINFLWYILQNLLKHLLDFVLCILYICACTCVQWMCMCACIYVVWYTCTCVHMFVGSRGRHLPRLLCTLYVDKGSLTTPVVYTNWPVSFIDATVSTPPHQIIGIGDYTRFFMWVLGSQVSGSHGRHFPVTSPDQDLAMICPLHFLGEELLLCS